MCSENDGELLSVPVKLDAGGEMLETEFLALKHESRILGHSFNPVCGFSMMEQVKGNGRD